GGANTQRVPLKLVAVDTGTNMVTFQSPPPDFDANAVLSAYYPAGNGGTITITSNASTTGPAFTINAGTTTNGVNGTITANGFAGGLISVKELGGGGISVTGTNIAPGIAATPAALNGVLPALATSAGNGGNIALLAPAGPVAVSHNLDVSGSSALVANNGQL